MPEIKTVFTQADPARFLDAVEPAAKRADALILDAMFRRVTGFAPRMFGPTIVGYGSYAYTYASGHSGVACATGFSPRKAALTLYGVGTYQDWQGMEERLGKHQMGKGCLYVRKLSDIDMDVLEAMVAKGLQNLASHWPVTPT